MSALDQLADELAEKVRPKLRAIIQEEIAAGIIHRSDPLLTVREAAIESNLSESMIRLLVRGGKIRRAPDIAEIRIRKSVLDAYGK